MDELKVAIIGAGKIGQAMGNLAESFSEVRYLDTKPGFSNDYTAIQDANLVLIAVNTTENDGYNCWNVESCLAKLQQHQIKAETVVLSTCPPSFFDKPRNIIYSPLFIRQGSIQQDIESAEFVLIGSHQPASTLIDFYSKIRSGYKFIELEPQEAAIVKMGINGFLCVKVAYANMIGDFCRSKGARAEEVLSAIGDCKSINHRYFRYGFGYGGPCLPIDNRTLAEEINNTWPLRIDEENQRHLEFQIAEFQRDHPDKHQEYLFEDVSYKKDVPIIIASQKLELAKALAQDGYQIKIKESQEVCKLIESELPGLFSFEIQ